MVKKGRVKVRMLLIPALYEQKISSMDLELRRMCFEFNEANETPNNGATNELFSSTELMLTDANDIPIYPRL